MREMPIGKDKYRGIERALKQLISEGWPIEKITDKNGIAWYRAVDGFLEFYVKTLKEKISKHRKRMILREVRRLNNILKIEDLLMGGLPNLSHLEIEKNSDGSFIIPLSAIPKLLKRI